MIVYICGGVTYEESFHIYRLNKELQGHARIVIGGSTIHNSRSFLNDILYHSQSARSIPDAVWLLRNVPTSSFQRFISSILYICLSLSFALFCISISPNQHFYSFFILSSP